MKILFVSLLSNPLNHPKDGDAQRTILLLKACAKIAEVDLLTFAGKSEAEMERVRVVYDRYMKICETRASRWEKWVKVLPVSSKEALFPVSKSCESVVDRIVQAGDYDFIVSRYFHRTLLCGLWKYHEKLVVDFDDSPSAFFLHQVTDNSTTSLKIRSCLAAWKAERISRRAIKKIHAAFFANTSQAKDFKALHLPNIPFYESSCLAPDFNTHFRRLLFVGQLDYLPNRKGLDHFFEKIYPSLCKRISNLEFHVVGVMSDNALRERWESYQGVMVTGFVDDLDQEYEQAHAVVIPIYQSGGTNIKMLEAMKMNRACVTTKIVIENMNWNFDNGWAYYAADKDEDFVDYVEELLNNERLNVEMAEHGKCEVNKHYSFDAFCRTVALSLKG